MPARVILKEPDRPGRPHPAVPATFSRQAGEAVIRPCRTLVRLTERFALQGCQLCPCLHALSASAKWGLAPTAARCLSPILTRLAGEAVQTTSITLGNARKNRTGRPHPAVPATFSRQVGEAVIRPCRTLVRLTGRFALQGCQLCPCLHALSASSKWGLAGDVCEVPVPHFDGQQTCQAHTILCL